MEELSKKDEVLNLVRNSDALCWLSPVWLDHIEHVSGTTQNQMT
jgi:hypothetical protein